MYDLYRHSRPDVVVAPVNAHVWREIHGRRHAAPGGHNRHLDEHQPGCTVRVLGPPADDCAAREEQAIERVSIG